jgi:ParB family transcriptional regulator, chromosome partitioning protein
MSETRRIDSIIVGQRFRRDFGDIEGLADSIKALGLLQPIVVTPDGRLLCGERRLRACRLLGLAEISVTVREERHDRS